MQKYYQNEPKFNDVCSRNNLSKINDGACIINIDDYESIGTHWIAFYVNGKNVTYFDSFGVEYIPKEIKKIIGNENIIIKICTIQAYDSIMSGYFGIWVINFMLKDKILLEYTNIFSPNEYRQNNKIIKKFFL